MDSGDREHFKFNEDDEAIDEKRRLVGVHIEDGEAAARELAKQVRVPSRSISPPWGSIRFRLALRTYAPWGVRVVSQTKSRNIPTRNVLPLFFVLQITWLQRSAARTFLGKEPPTATWQVSQAVH